MMEAADKLEELAHSLLRNWGQRTDHRVDQSEVVLIRALTIIVSELRRLISILPEARLTDRERMPVGAALRPHDASKTGPKWAKSDLSMYSKFRADGWPLCPACGTDH